MITPVSKIKIFISYHREDTAASSGRLFNYLSNAFGEKNVFKDIFSMEGGDKISDKIKNTIENSDVLLTVIGTKWVDIQKNRNSNHENKDDWVQYEIVTAFKKNIIVIPVLVDNALMPDRQILPKEIELLSDINACELSFKHYEFDTKDLIKDIRLKVKERRKVALRRFNWVSGLAILLFLTLGFYLLINNLHRFEVGQNYGGGIIFKVDDSKQHGLICSPIDINASLDWINSLSACKAYRGGGYNDWRLPTKDELADLYSKKSTINNFSTDCNANNFGNCSYWSSTTMDNSTYAWNLYFTNGLFWSNYDKKGLAKVRAIRSF